MTHTLRFALLVVDGPRSFELGYPRRLFGVTGYRYNVRAKALSRFPGSAWLSARPRSALFPLGPEAKWMLKRATDQAAPSLLLRPHFTSLDDSDAQTASALPSHRHRQRARADVGHVLRMEATAPVDHPSSKSRPIAFSPSVRL